MATSFSISDGTPPPYRTNGLPDPNKDAARAYLTQPREAALSAHRQLEVAYRAEEQLRAELAEAGPLSKAVQLKVENTIRQSIAASIARGVEPVPTPRTVEALRIQVAYDNSEHAIGARRLDPASTLNLSARDRELLVRYAEHQVQAATGKSGEAELQVRAHDIASNIGRLDLPRSANPFRDPRLIEAYATEQAAARTAGRSAPSRDRDGASR